jgi:hypothetical protein
MARTSARTLRGAVVGAVSASVLAVLVSAAASVAGDSVLHYYSSLLRFWMIAVSVGLASGALVGMAAPVLRQSRFSAAVLGVLIGAVSGPIFGYFSTAYDIPQSLLPLLFFGAIFGGLAGWWLADVFTKRRGGDSGR